MTTFIIIWFIVGVISAIIMKFLDSNTVTPKFFIVIVFLGFVPVTFLISSLIMYFATNLAEVE